MVFSLINCNNPTIPLIIGHRGAKGHIVENTLESINMAIELGADGIEIDTVSYTHLTLPTSDLV